MGNTIIYLGSIESITTCEGVDPQNFPILISIRTTSMTPEGVHQFQEYLFPPVGEEVDSLTLYQKCIQQHIHTLTTHKFFRGYRLPSDSVRGQIYRAVFLLNIENNRQFQDNAAWKVICTKYGVIILHRKQLLSPKFSAEADEFDVLKSSRELDPVHHKKRNSSNFQQNNSVDVALSSFRHNEYEKEIEEGTDQQIQLWNFYFNQTEQVWCPTGFARLNPTDFRYSRRLLTDFLRGQNYDATQIHVDELGKCFLCCVLSKPIRTKLEKKWPEYLQGGVLRTFTFPKSGLLTALRLFPWNDRIGFIHFEEEISMTVRATSKYLFQEKVKQVLEPSSEFQNWYHLDCSSLLSNLEDPEDYEDSEDLEKEINDSDDTIENLPVDDSNEIEDNELSSTVENLENLENISLFRSEQSMFGMIYLAGADWEVIPLLGTSDMYVRNRFQQNLTVANLQSKLTSLQFEINNCQITDGIECYSQCEFREMNILEQIDCLFIDGHYFSRFSLLRASDQKHFHNPLTQQEFPIVHVHNLQSFRNWISLDYQTGFLCKDWEPELITRKEDKFIDIYLIFNAEVSLRIWSIPDLSETSHYRLTEGALELITTKFTNKLLLNERYFPTDPCLSLSPKILYLYEQTQQKPLSHFLGSELIQRFTEQIRLIDSI